MESGSLQVQIGERLLLLPPRHPSCGRGEMRGGLTKAEAGERNLAPLDAGGRSFESEAIEGGILKLLDFGEEGVGLVEIAGLEGGACRRF